MWKTLSKFYRSPEFLSTGFLFMVNSMLISFWYTRLPEVKSRLQLSEGDLGIALFFIPLGAILAMLMCSRLIRRWGEGRVALITGTFFALSMPFPFMAENFALLACSLFFVGAFSGSMDIAMNALASSFEKIYQTSIMSACHGFWSLGSMLGAVISSLAAGWHFPALWQTLGGVAAALLLLWGFVARRVAGIHQDKGGDAGFSWPTRPIIGLAIVGFCIMMGEGAIADWSTIYLADFLLAPTMITGLGYAGFSLCMTIGRFYGDELIQRLGGGRIIRIGSLTALVGIGLVLLQQTAAAMVGFSLIGLGFSCIVPVLFSQSAKVAGVSPSQGIASVASSGFVGILLGPVVLGFIAEATNLGISFFLLLLLTFVAWAISMKVIPQGR